MTGESSQNPWIMAARPKTLPAGAGPVLIGLSLAGSLNNLDWTIAFLTLICALLLQISSNLINDYYDGVKGLDKEDRLGPPRAVALGLLIPNQVKKGFILTLALAFFVGLYLMYIGGLPIIIIGLSSLFFAWAYTGGPFPLSYFGLGEVFAFLFFGPIAVYGTWFLQTKISGVPPTDVLLMGSSVGLISSALMGVNNLRDIVGDKREGKTTLATLIGDHTMRKIIVLFLILGQILGFFVLVERNSNLIIVALIPMALFYKTWWQLLGTTVGKDLNNTLASVGKYLFLFSLTYSCLILMTNKTLGL